MYNPIEEKQALNKLAGGKEIDSLISFLDTPVSKGGGKQETTEEPIKKPLTFDTLTQDQKDAYYLGEQEVEERRNQEEIKKYS